MNFNIKKCKVLHNGSKNEKTSYGMNSVELHQENEEKDIGIITSNDQMQI